VKKPRRKLWILAGGLIVVSAAAAAAWRWSPLKEVLSPQVLQGWIGEYRDHWLAFPFTVFVYVLVELVFFPVLLLVLVTGLAFGPWLGSAYALAGCMASGAVGYGIGHLLGHERLERWGGARIRRLSDRLGRKGVMAVFVARKIPVPYTLVNLVAGASRIRFLDFMVGTLLGMGTGVIALAVFGHQLKAAWSSPSWGSIGLAVGLFFIPVVISLVIQRLLKLKRSSPAAGKA